MTETRYVIAQCAEDVRFTLYSGGLSHPAKKSAVEWLAKQRAIAPRIWRKEKIFKAVLSVKEER